MMMTSSVTKSFDEDKIYDKESDFQVDAQAFIKSMGGCPFKLFTSAYGKKGDPDLVCCYKGLFVAFELKVKDNKPSKLQDNKLRKVINAGGIAKPVWTLREIKETLNEISRIQ